jgi:hypothetical protein
VQGATQGTNLVFVRGFLVFRLLDQAQNFFHFFQSLLQRLNNVSHFQNGLMNCGTAGPFRADRSACGRGRR